MIKFRIYFDKDKETKWLNEMSQQGWAMTSFCVGVYTFEKCTEGKWNYQVDFGEKFGRCTEDYRDFMRESGIEIVQNWGYWVILRKLAEEGEFVLYSDVESSIERYKKILRMFKIAAILEIICFFWELSSALRGRQSAWVYVFIVFVWVLAVINVCVKTKNTVRELEAKKTCIEPGQGRGTSPILAAALLCNACGMLALNSHTLPDMVKRCIMITAIVLTVVGVYKTISSITQNKQKGTKPHDY